MKVIVPTVAAVMFIAAGGSADAEDWKPMGQFGYFGIGKATEIEMGHLFWTGEFSGTFFSDKTDGLFDHAGVRCPGFNDLDMNHKKGRAAGYCIVTDRAGDQAYLSWRCEGNGCKGTFEYTGGTGKLATVSGSNTFSSTTSVRWKDGAVSGVATWNR